MPFPVVGAAEAAGEVDAAIRTKVHSIPETQIEDVAGERRNGLYP